MPYDGFRVRGTLAELRVPRAPRRAPRRARDAGGGALRGRPRRHALQAPAVRRGPRPACGREGGPLPDAQEGQQQLIDRLFDKGVIRATQRSLFHDLRRMGNAAVHEGKGDHREALHQLRMARELAIWFQRSYGNDRKFDPGPFIPPPEPKKAEAGLHDELQPARRRRRASQGARGSAAGHRGGPEGRRRRGHCEADRSAARDEGARGRRHLGGARDRADRGSQPSDDSQGVGPSRNRRVHEVACAHRRRMEGVVAGERMTADT
jgi:hypothetical protein